MNCPRLVRIIVSATCLTVGQWAAGASIHFSPAAVTGLAPGDRFTLEILGSDFVDGDGIPGSLGGGLNVRWDPAILSIASLADIELLFPSDRSLNTDGSNNSGKGALDAVTGLLRDLSVLSLSAPAVDKQDFKIAKITFTAAGPGSSLVSLVTGTYALGGADDWVTTLGEVFTDLTFSTASVTVEQTAVPLPASLCLLPAALGFLSNRTRRNTSAS